MRSKNKPRQTAAQAEHAAKVAACDCVICDAPGPSEVHEPEQGLWHIAIALCPECHRGPQGWHGYRDRWKLRHMDELKAINRTLERIYG